MEEIKSPEEIVREMLQEMAIANAEDHTCRDFQYPKFIVEVYNKEYFINEIPHLHVISKQEGWNIRMSMRGDFLSIKVAGNRSQKDKFMDIEKRIKKWLSMNCVDLPTITNYEEVQLMWNKLNPDKKITIEKW